MSLPDRLPLALARNDAWKSLSNTGHFEIYLEKVNRSAKITEQDNTEMPNRYLITVGPLIIIPFMDKLVFLRMIFKNYDLVSGRDEYYYTD